MATGFLIGTSVFNAIGIAIILLAAYAYGKKH